MQYAITFKRKQSAAYKAGKLASRAINTMKDTARKAAKPFKDGMASIVEAGDEFRKGMDS